MISLFFASVLSLLSHPSQSNPGGQVTLAVGPEATSFLSFCFSPDSKRIAYTKSPDAEHFDSAKVEAWIADLDGTHAERIALGASNICWNRDGSKLYYIRDIRERAEVYVFDLATIQEKTLGLRLRVSQLDSSPRGGVLVISVPVSEKESQLFTCDQDGMGVRQITWGPGKAFNTLWSQDGRNLIYFRELGDGKDQIYSIDSTGGHSRHLSSSGEHNFYPAFGPKGTVSYTVDKGSSKKHMIFDRHGRYIRDFPFSTFRVAWSRDGAKAIFAAGAFPRMALYVCNADGTSPVRVGRPQ